MEWLRPDNPALIFLAFAAVMTVFLCVLLLVQHRAPVLQQVDEVSTVYEDVPRRWPALSRLRDATTAFWDVLTTDEVMSDEDEVGAPVSVVPRGEPIREPETQPVENLKPALDVGDIKDGGGLTANQRAEYEAVLRGEKTLTAETSGKIWARVFAVRPDRVYAERTRILALIESEQKEAAQDAAAESLAREVADPSIIVPEFTPPTLELEHAA